MYNSYMKKLLLIIFYGLLTLFIALVAFLSFSYIVISPKIDGLYTKVLMENKTNNNTYTPLSKISLNIQKAAIASQDESFYQNPGIDLKGTIRAVFYTIISGKRQGASTITEQLAKNVYFNDKDNLQTDLETKLYAVFLNLKYPKNRILEMYLNEIYFGKNAYGIAQASATYFRTTADKLSLPQSAFLIGLIEAPSYLSDNSSASKKQAILVLESMEKEKFISQYEEKKAEETILNGKNY